MRFVELNGTATLWADLPARADATPTFIARGPSGGSLLTGSVTLGSADTTLSGAAAAGATTLSVTAATGIVAGRKYLVGGTESAGGERITVKSVASTTVTLVRPLLRAKASGAALQSTRVEVALTSAAAPSVGRHYHVAVTWALSAVTQAAVRIPYDVARYVPSSDLVSLDDVVDLDPMLLKRLPAGTWPPAIMERAWDMMLRRVAQKVDPGAIVAPIDLTTPHSYLVRVLLAETAGPDFESYRAQMGLRYTEEFDNAMGSTAVDTNQDGNVSETERWHTFIPVARG